MNRELLLVEWRRSVRGLEAARLLAREGYAEDAVSRTYYAILHAGKAALLVHDVTVDSHAALRRLFSEHLVPAGRIEREWSAQLRVGLDDRLAADHDPVHVVAAEDALQEVERATAFVARIRSYLLDNTLTDSDLESGVANP
ncbi:MAG: HEPN domain-containing protein [Acidobacteria bacterium]|nr:HEPN domain-containing protein [Acidobacteriota bacterium]MYH30979.1 HEPN domain-containing protein [Acidobacteriota bacterium]MYK87454.1 HEPN domain-containing protein [Acidobacteriota bacterium]